MSREEWLASETPRYKPSPFFSVIENRGEKQGARTQERR
jgi:hypothetical protein